MCNNNFFSVLIVQYWKHFNIILRVYDRGPDLGEGTFSQCFPFVFLFFLLFFFFCFCIARFSMPFPFQAPETNVMSSSGSIEISYDDNETTWALQKVREAMVMLRDLWITKKRSTGSTLIFTECLRHFFCFFLRCKTFAFLNLFFLA